MLRLFLILVALASPISAEPMSAAEFEAYTTGKTLFYGRDQELFGVEEYLEGRRVRWSFLDGKCQEGYWYEEGPLICFVYETGLDPQCWTFELASGGLVARFENNPASRPLYEARDTGERMVCLGPETGV